MALPSYGFQLTSHAVNRLYERHPGIFRDPTQTGKARWDAAYSVLNDSSQERGFTNDSKFMLYLYEQYGYDKEYVFFMNGKVLFVGVIDAEGKKIVTTLDRTTHQVRHLRNVQRKYSREVAR